MHDMSLVKNESDIILESACADINQEEGLGRSIKVEHGKKNKTTLDKQYKRESSCMLSMI